jgi:RNase P subunit RPR2
MPKVKNDVSKPEPEKMVSIYDPTVNAFREVPESLARKFIESAKEVDRKLKEEK